MGTQIQSETFLLQHYSKRDLNVNMSSGMWPSYDEEKAIKSSQHHDSSMAWRPLIGGYLGHDKGKVRETIMKHEFIFRHQVQELHRLYRRQRDLMYEMKMNELRRHQKKTERTWHGSYFPSSYSMLGKFPPSSMSDKQSPATVMDGKSFLSQSASQNMGHLEKHVAHKSSNNMFFVKPLELEILADVDMNNEEAIRRERFCGLARNAVDCKSRPCEPLQDRDLKPSLDDVLKCHSNAGDLISDTRLKGRNHLADLNEPIPLVGTSLSFSMTSSGSMLCPTENVQRWDLTTSANSSFGTLHPITAIKGKTGLNNLLKDKAMIGKEQMIYGFKTGISSGDSPLEFGPVPVEHEIVRRNKRKIFGVQILEEDDEPSVVSSAITHLNHKSNQPQTDPSSIAYWGAAPDYLSKKVISSQENLDVTTSESSCWKSESHLQNLNFVGGAVLDDSDTKNFSSSKNKVPSQGSFHVHHQWKFNLLNGSSSAGFNCLNGRNAVNLVADQLALRDPLSASSRSKALPWFMIKPQHNGEKARGKESSSSLNLDFMQKCSQHLFKKTDVSQKSSEPTNLKQESNLSASTGDAQIKKVNCINSKKIFGFHIPEVVSKTNDTDPTDSVSEASCSDGAKSQNQLEEEPNVLEKGLSNYISSLRHHIDLNFSMNEEETSSAPTLPAALVKIATREIDLEVSAVLESELSVSEACHRESELSLDESNRNHEELIRIAAESLVSISSAPVKDVADCGISQAFEDTSADCLKWFAEVISSHESDQEYKIREVSIPDEDPGEIDGSSDEDSIPDEMDYFEFMTLQLKDVKEESYCYKLPCINNHDDEEPAVTKVQKRPRRGQGRRGRRTKDFQRDVLPSLVSLSKQDVVEDLQTIEQLLRASGCTWQSSLLRRNRAKNGRARRRAGGSPPASAKGSISPLPVTQTVLKDQGRGNTGLTGWGKRTRRLPRQRNSRNNHVLPSTC